MYHLKKEDVIKKEEPDSPPAHIDPLTPPVKQEEEPPPKPATPDDPMRQTSVSLPQQTKSTPDRMAETQATVQDNKQDQIMEATMVELRAQQADKQKAAEEETKREENRKRLDEQRLQREAERKAKEEADKAEHDKWVAQNEAAKQEELAKNKAERDKRDAEEKALAEANAKTLASTTITRLKPVNARPPPQPPGTTTATPYPLSRPPEPVVKRGTGVLAVHQLVVGVERSIESRLEALQALLAHSASRLTPDQIQAYQEESERLQTLVRRYKLQPDGLTVGEEDPAEIAARITDPGEPIDGPPELYTEPYTFENGYVSKDMKRAAPPTKVVPADIPLAQHSTGVTTNNAQKAETQMAYKQRMVKEWDGAESSFRKVFGETRTNQSAWGMTPSHSWTVKQPDGSTATHTPSFETFHPPRTRPSSPRMADPLQWMRTSGLPASEASHADLEATAQYSPQVVVRGSKVGQTWQQVAADNFKEASGGIPYVKPTEKDYQPAPATAAPPPVPVPVPVPAPPVPVAKTPAPPPVSIRAVVPQKKKRQPLGAPPKDPAPVRPVVPIAKPRTPTTDKQVRDAVTAGDISAQEKQKKIAEAQAKIDARKQAATQATDATIAAANAPLRAPSEHSKRAAALLTEADLEASLRKKDFAYRTYLERAEDRKTDENARHTLRQEAAKRRKQLIAEMEEEQRKKAKK
jgi:hypothetical protein